MSKIRLREAIKQGLSTQELFDHGLLGKPLQVKESHSDQTIDEMNLDREIEEAAETNERYSSIRSNKVSFIQGANWMKGKMYSESEVINLLHKLELQTNKSLASFWELNKKPL